jgi:hypothetical protein
MIPTRQAATDDVTAGTINAAAAAADALSHSVRRIRRLDGFITSPLF